MPKTYLRYAPNKTVGLVASPSANVVVDSKAGHAFTACLEDVGVWSLTTGQQAHLLHVEEDHGEVTCLQLRPGDADVAVGHADGRIHIWHIAARDLKVTLNGHSSAVSCLSFNPAGTLLASGSRDTHVIVWDVVAEAGLFRLRGHKDEVTACRLLHDSAYVVSCSKDALLKVWDLSTEHCVQTCVGHRGEVWTLDVSPDQSRLVTGSVDNQLRVWTIDATPKAGAGAAAPSVVADAGADAAGADPPAVVAPPTTPTLLHPYGAITRLRNERAVTVAYSPDGRYLACQGAGRAVEVYRVRSHDEVKRRLLRRKRRQREKAKVKPKSGKGAKAKAAAADGDGDGDGEAGSTGDGGVIAQDEVELWACITTKAKVRSVAFIPSGDAGGDAKLAVSLHNNLLETYVLQPGEAEVGKAAPRRVRSFAAQGHRSDVRDAAVSSDGAHLLTTSAGLTKVWNTASMAAIRTMSSGFGLCCVFGPGDRYGIVGTKDGALQMFDLASGDLVEEVADAHEQAVWSIAVRPDGRGMVSGSADKSAKFWDFDLKSGDTAGSKVLTLVHTRTLKMADDILCVRYSHHTDAAKLLLAVALLDCSVKVFYDDSLKFFLSLYGHKLPVMSMSISTDNSLLVSSSADKNVKLWGLDFGDCHRSLFAHDDSVVAVEFVPRTHMFFTGSKDHSVKMWDGDRFEHIQSLTGHKSEVWCLAVSPDGNTVYTGSHDRSVRVWSKTDEIVFLDEEKERRLEDALDKEAAETLDETDALNTEAESGRAGRKSKETLTAVDRLVEALEYADDEYEQWTEHLEDARDADADAKRQRTARAGAGSDAGAGASAGSAGDAPPLPQAPSKNPLFLGFILRTLRDIRPSEVEETMHALLFSQAQQLLKHLHHVLRRGLATELAAKCVLILLKAHHKQIIANGSMRTSLASLKHYLQLRIREHKDSIGFNLAALRHHQRWIQSEKAAKTDAGPVAAPKPIRLGRRAEVHMF